MKHAAEGFGPGIGIQLLASSVSSGWVAGIDPSGEMIEQAKVRNAHEIGTGRVELQRGSIASLPFENGTFVLATGFSISNEDIRLRALLYSAGVPLVLVPFDAARHITVTDYDLNHLATAGAAARWLAAQSDFWQQDLHRNGFYPFDLLAAGYAILPDAFDCSVRHARLGFSVFLEPFGMGRDLEVGADLTGPQVLYCTGIEAGLKSFLLERLMTTTQDMTSAEGVLLIWWLDEKMRMRVEEVNILFRQRAIPAVKAVLRTS